MGRGPLALPEMVQAADNGEGHPSAAKAVLI